MTQVVLGEGILVVEVPAAISDVNLTGYGALAQLGRAVALQAIG